MPIRNSQRNIRGRMQRMDSHSTRRRIRINGLLWTPSSNEAVVQIIVGDKPIEYIEQASKDWLAGGGEQIIKEINEAAKK